MHLIDLNDDKNFTLQNRSVGREGLKAWALFVVPLFSLFPPRLAFLMLGALEKITDSQYWIF